uniref:Uncharacterized protein n=1 Tax=Rhizophora mucronata TaxID=61149 RepID=A0A2P2P2G4_RHIMU
MHLGINLWSEDVILFIGVPGFHYQGFFIGSSTFEQGFVIE